MITGTAAVMINGTCLDTEQTIPSVARGSQPDEREESIAIRPPNLYDAVTHAPRMRFLWFLSWSTTRVCRRRPPTRPRNCST